MNKKILALLLSIIILLSFVSCLKTESPNDTTADGETTPLSPTIALILSGNAECTVVRPDNAKDDSLTVKAAINILNAINEIAKEKQATIATDHKKVGEIYNSESIEILVGITGYDETKTVMDTIGYGDYIVKAEGNKIVIGGWMESAVFRAANDFIFQIKKISDDENSLNYQRTDVLTGVFHTDLSHIPVCEGGTLVSTYDCGNYATMAILKNCSVDNFNKYTEKLPNHGFEFYAKNIMGQNIYSSFITDKYLLNVLYTDYDKNIRIIIEPLTETSLTGKKDEDLFTKVVDSTIALMGVENGSTIKEDGRATYQNGVCLVIRLEDNSLIIYDGGFNRILNASQLYNLMKEMSGQAKPTIAAWIFSHAHGDHIGAFLNFANNSSSLINVERFILNLPAANAGSASTEGYSWTTIKAAMDKFPNAKVTKAHTGQVFYIRNSKIEILYTLELFAPRELTYYNTSTIVCSVEISGFKMMLLGDLSEDGSLISSRAFGSYLQSDLMTVAHHGYTGGTTQIHSLIKPRYVLWPVGSDDYPRIKDMERNSYFFAPDTTVEKIFVAMKDIYILPIPYTGTGEIKK